MGLYNICVWALVFGFVVFERPDFCVQYNEYY